MASVLYSLSLLRSDVIGFFPPEDPSVVVFYPRVFENKSFYSFRTVFYHNQSNEDVLEKLYVLYNAMHIFFSVSVVVVVKREVVIAREILLG